MRRPFVRITLAFLVLATGCAPDITETDFYSRHPENSAAGSEETTLGQNTINGVTVTVLASEALHVGPNVILVETALGANPITSGTVQVSARWITNARELDPPFGRASASVTDDDNRFQIPVYLLEPVDEGHWVLDLAFTIEGVSGQWRLDVDVEPDMWVQYVDSTEAGDGYYVAWLEPARPQTGQSDLELGLYTLTDDGFAPVDDATLNLYPYMDMGGGEGHSAPFEAPVHAGSGLYRGSVNYVMAGGWDLTVYVDRPGTSATVVFKGFTVY